jgi:hypothetical protein
LTPLLLHDIALNPAHLFEGLFNPLLNVSGYFILQVYSPGADEMMAQGPGEASQYPTKHALYSDIYYGGMNFYIIYFNAMKLMSDDFLVFTL